MKNLIAYFEKSQKNGRPLAQPDRFAVNSWPVDVENGIMKLSCYDTPSTFFDVPIGEACKRFIVKARVIHTGMEKITITSCI